ncbi:MAG: hypothetical protein H0X27_12490, partial [Caulobacteraceae bacterium]|nr:hypothetical protein [Caulobacteraceae bacterium]
MVESENRYLFEYRHDGSDWALEVWARDMDDAKVRLQTLPWAKYMGEIASSGHIPAGAQFSANHAPAPT